MEETASLLLIALEIVAAGVLIAGLAWHATTPKPPRKFRSY